MTSRERLWSFRSLLKATKFARPSSYWESILVDRMIKVGVWKGLSPVCALKLTESPEYRTWIDLMHMTLSTALTAAIGRETEVKKAEYAVLV